MKLDEVAQEEAPSSRANWVDGARGVGIILVVYGHALRGLFPDETRRPAWASAQDNIIYAFHMPLFFILAGLWLWSNMECGRAEFLKSKVVAIVYPYFLWSLIEGSIEIIFARYANSPISPHDLTMIPFVPIEQFWFLYALFFGQLILVSFFPYRAFLPLAAVAAVGVLKFAPFLSATINEICTALVYLVVGSLAATRIKSLAERSDQMVLGVAIGCWVLFTAIFAFTHVVPGRASAWGCALTGSVGTMATATLLARSGKAEFLELLGRGSMPIYLMHTIASAAIRIELFGTGLSLPPMLMLAVITIFGLCAPLGAWWLAARCGATRLFGLPFWPSCRYPRHRVRACKH